MWDLVKMVVARQSGAVEQATVVIGAPSRFWRWLPGYSEDHPGFDLLGSNAETPTSTKSDFLAGSAWNQLFEDGMDRDLPERLWTSLLAGSQIESPWAETEIRLLEVKGLGQVGAVRPTG
jgi:hypothetical protein